MDNELLLMKLIQTLQLFSEFSEKDFSGRYGNLNMNEVHAIDYIGRTEYANVTKITQHLQITKGAVTKITKRLMNSGYVSSYKREDNRKEKYFRLTNEGMDIFIIHEKVHMESVERDQQIFELFNEDEKDVIARFLDILKDDIEYKLKNAGDA